MSSNTITKESISDIRISSRSTADVHFGGKIVRMDGEIEGNYFLADAHSMFWLAEEDSHDWPWTLPEESRRNVLTDAERDAVMEAVSAYGKHPNGQIFFMTKELEECAAELAGKVQSKDISLRKAASLLKEAFPGYPRGFYKNEIDVCRHGYRWYK